MAPGNGRATAVRWMIIIQFARDADTRIRAAAGLGAAAEKGYHDNSAEKSCSRWAHGNIPLFLRYRGNVVWKQSFPRSAQMAPGLFCSSRRYAAMTKI